MELEMKRNWIGKDVKMNWERCEIELERMWNW
jgi:hypothetical protein